MTKIPSAELIPNKTLSVLVGPPDQLLQRLSCHPRVLLEPLGVPLAEAGLAKISLLSGDKSEAVRLFQQALAKEWPVEFEPGRKEIQIPCA